MGPPESSRRKNQSNKNKFKQYDTGKNRSKSRRVNARIKNQTDHLLDQLKQIGQVNGHLATGF